MSNYNNNNNTIIIISRSANNNNNTTTKYIKRYTFVVFFLFLQFYPINYNLLNLNNYS